MVHGSRKGSWQDRLSALSANTHTRRVAVKRVNQILKLPLSPLYKRKGKRRFSPWVTFFRPAFIIQACFSEEMEKCELDFLRNLDLFSVVRNLLVPFTACPANVTDSPALQCQHNYPAYSLMFRMCTMQSGTTTIRGRRSCMCTVQGREGEIERGKRQGFFQHHLMGPTPKCSELLTPGVFAPYF